MSFSLSRVPKRVALTALQGLVVGTSCTLLFVIEDRRRRIDQARRAVHNAQKIRSARQYRKKKPPQQEEESQALSTTLKQTTVASHQQPLVGIRPTAPPPLPPPTPSLSKAMAYTPIADKIQRIKEATALGDPDSLRVGVLTIRRIAKTPVIVREEDQSRLMQAALTLYRKYQDGGAPEQTARLLHDISKIGPVPYVLSQNHVERALAELRTKIQHIQTPASWMAAKQKLDKILALLLPEDHEVTTIPPSRKWDWTLQAERTIRLALDLGGIHSASSTSLTKSEPFGRLVRTFVALQGKLSEADLTVWTTIGNVISDSVQVGVSPDPAASLLYLAQYCPPGLVLRTTWVAKLLSVDWQQFNKNKDLSQSLALFTKFEALGGCNKVTHLDGVYRVMMEMALEAEAWQTADDFLGKLQTIKPYAATHPQVLGMLAKAKAKMGDWDSVWEDLGKMEPKTDPHFGPVFVPILQEYSKTHTVRQVDQFLRLSIQELRVPITPHMVTLVGNRYGELRDVTSFVTWLEYCAGQGVRVDAAFGNTILQNCRRHWDFDYQSLKRVYRTLRTLNPSFVDEVTQNMLVSAALTATRRAASPMVTQREVASLAIKFRSRARPSDPHDMRLWMRRAFAMHNYRLVQNMYEKAAKQGALLDDGHLLLHIRAILLLHANMAKAVRVLKEAKEQGILVERATVEVFTFCVRRFFSDPDLPEQNKERVLENVRGVLSQLQAAGLDVSSASLLRVAHLCLWRIHHVEGALNFAMSALHLKKAQYPNDIPTFQVFLLAYSFRIDLRGLQWTIRGASEAGLLHKERAMEALRGARSLFLKQMQTSNTREAIYIVEQAIGHVRSIRLESSQVRQLMEKTTMGIMASAALEVTAKKRSVNQDETIEKIQDELQQLVASS